MKTVKIEVPGGILLKTVGKPFIRKDKFGTWVCADNSAFVAGFGYSPAAAYAAWKRNHFLHSSPLHLPHDERGSPTP